jgi:PAS domain S-box-containing protein
MTDLQRNDGQRPPVSPSAPAVDPVAGAMLDPLRLLVESVRDYGIFGLDTTGHVISWNVGAEHIKGYRSAEILGRHFSVFYPPAEVAAGVPDAELAAATSAGRFEDEGWRVRKDGTRFWANVIITALYDDQQRLCGFGKITRDMTERRAAEERLRDSEGQQRLAASSLAALNQTLERERRQLSLARDAAELATEEALAANRVKSAFLATMSHELRTPMNAVIGLTSLLLDTTLDDQQRSLAETVRDSGDVLLGMINDMLDYTRMESGALDLELSPFDLTTCLEDAVAGVALSAERRGVELVAELDETCPRLVLGDVARFQQVIVHLLANAVKFTTRGEVSISAWGEQLTTTVPGPVRVTVSVRDTANGLSADQAARIFEPLTQTDTSATRVTGGTGMGLAISRRLARAMKGDIEVSSVVGSGSTFTFTAVLSSQIDYSAGSADQASSAGRLVGRTALIVDDNTTSRRMLQQLLSRWRLSCLAVGSAAEAITLLARGTTFDVALVDLDMPGTDGLTLATAIETQLGVGTLPIIVLTGIEPASASAEVLRRRPRVTKPVTQSVLRQQLLELFPGESVRSTVRRRPVIRQPRERPPSRPLEVLLVEDNIVNQRVGQLMLTRLGHRVHTAEDGVEALAATHASRYDVVLMDLRMPHMDGLEAARRIRAEIPTARQPRIVALTANVFVEARDACRAAGMDDYLAKPLRSVDLEAALARTTHDSDA